VIGRLDADGRRFVATLAAGADDVLDMLSNGDPLKAPIYVRALPEGNRVASSKAQMDQLLPVRAPGFRDDYEHVLVRRIGHLLEVTINRPNALNALHPPANAELAEVFDADFARPRGSLRRAPTLPGQLHRTPPVFQALLTDLWVDAPG
jgi:acetyl-CoA C-acetyltransferase